MAHRFFESTDNDYVLVGGVDTYWDSHLLARLDKEDRLNVVGAVDGFFPGEGASFLLLSSRRVAQASVDKPIKLYRPGLSKEPGHRYSTAPYLGEGLSEAAKLAATHAGEEKIHSLWTSMIYDGFCNKELGVMLSRTARRFIENPSINHPVDCFGDLGAAIGPTLISIIAEAAYNGAVETEYLVTCSSDLEHRAALRVSIQ